MTKEIAHPPAAGDPGDEQPEVVFIATNPEEQPLADELTRIAAWSKTNLNPIMDAAPVETPEWLKDNPKVCTFEKDGIRCSLPEGHPCKHESDGLPYFCYVPMECWGRTSCPRHPACSE